MSVRRRKVARRRLHKRSKNPVEVIRKLHASDTAGQLLAEQLILRYAEAYDLDDPTHITPLQLFDTFAVSGFDFVGQGSHGYGAIGVGAGVKIGVDIGTAILPGFVKADVSGGLVASGASETLLLLLRQPCECIQQPLMFMTGRGQLWQGECQFSAGISLGHKFQVNAAALLDKPGEPESESDVASKARFREYGTLALEKVGADAAAQLSASVDASYGGEYMMLRDPDPLWFGRPRDPALQALFAEFIGYGTKAGVKERVGVFFGKEKALLQPLFHGLSFWQTLQKAITKGGIPTAQLQQSLVDAQHWLEVVDTLASREGPEEVLAELEQLNKSLDEEKRRNWLERRFNKNEKRQLKRRASDLFDQLGLELLLPEQGRSGYASLSGWHDALGWLREALKMEPRKRRQLLNEISYHQKVVAWLGSSPEQPLEPGNPDSLTSRLCFLNMWGHGVKAGAGAKAELSADVKTPVLGLGLALKAGASISAEQKWTLYRLQHFNRAAECIDNQISQCIYTQDTAVSYTQTVVKGAIAGQILKDDEDLIEQKTGTKAQISTDKALVNTLSYESSQLTWQPVIGHNKVTLKPGTGLSFGHSITLDAFAAILEKDPGHEGVLASLADNLRVSSPDLLAAVEASAYLLDSDLPVEVLLVESIFAVGVGRNIPLTWCADGSPELGADIRSGLQVVGQKDMEADLQREATEKTCLQSIRLRYRIADSMDNGTTFTLGIPLPPFTLGVELTAVSRAGASGLVDLGAFWFGPGSVDSHGRQIVPYPEDSVPAVVLLHQ